MTAHGTKKLAPQERLDLLVAAILFEHRHVVLERSVRDLEGVVELVPLEHVVVAPRLVGVSMLGVDDAADRPHGPRFPLDPDDDPLFGAGVVDSGEDALRKAAGA